MSLADEIEQVLVRKCGFRPGRAEYRPGIFAGNVADAIAQAVRERFTLKRKKRNP
jgi:hypothetical protein